MKTYEAHPSLTVEEALRWEHEQERVSNSTFELVSSLRAAWTMNLRKTSRWWSHPEFYQRYLAIFLFECGRVYGIRQERMRRNARKAA